MQVVELSSKKDTFTWLQVQAQGYNVRSGYGRRLTRPGKFLSAKCLYLMISPPATQSFPTLKNVILCRVSCHHASHISLSLFSQLLEILLPFVVPSSVTDLINRSNPRGRIIALVPRRASTSPHGFPLMVLRIRWPLGQ